MLSAIAASQLAIARTPHAYFGIGAVGRLPDVLRDAGCDAVLVVTDTALATTPVIASRPPVILPPKAPPLIRPTDFDKGVGHDC